MSRARKEQNLRDLSAGLSAYAASNALPLPDPPAPATANLAAKLFLARSDSAAAFDKICSTGAILCSRTLWDRGLLPPKPDSAEAVLGTANDVFFFLSPFRYPDTQCGLLFRSSLEETHRAAGTATPFDSGGLLGRCTRARPDEPPCDFLARHELPIPDHRQLLARSIHTLFACSDDYLTDTAPSCPGPIGLTGGDARRWTHEVRIPLRVDLRSSHLQAAFITTRRARTSAITAFLAWCEREQVDYFTLPSPNNDEWAALKQACLDYIRGKLG